MRLFVAVYPSTEAREHLAAALPAGGRWSDPANWHITLAFLGEVGASTASALAPALEAVARDNKHVELRLTGSGRLGSALWVGVSGELGPLAHAVAGAVRGVGIALQDRPFHPHLTVARGDKLDPRVLASYSGPSWFAEELRLVQSHLGERARHVPVGSWRLGG